MRNRLYSCSVSVFGRLMIAVGAFIAVVILNGDARAFELLQSSSDMVTTERSASQVNADDVNSLSLVSHLNSILNNGGISADTADAAGTSVEDDEGSSAGHPYGDDGVTFPLGPVAIPLDSAGTSVEDDSSIPEDDSSINSGYSYEGDILTVPDATWTWEKDLDDGNRFKYNAMENSGVLYEIDSWGGETVIGRFNDVGFVTTQVTTCSGNSISGISSCIVSMNTIVIPEGSELIGSYTETLVYQDSNGKEIERITVTAIYGTPFVPVAIPLDSAGTSVEGSTSSIPDSSIPYVEVGLSAYSLVDCDSSVDLNCEE